MRYLLAALLAAPAFASTADDYFAFLQEKQVSQGAACASAIDDAGALILCRPVLQMDRETITLWSNDFKTRVRLAQSAAPVVAETRSRNGVEVGRKAFCGGRFAETVEKIYANPARAIYVVTGDDGVSRFAASCSFVMP